MLAENVTAVQRDARGSQVPLCFMPFPSCTDVEYHAGLIVIRVVFLCLPSFEVDILSLDLFFFSFFSGFVFALLVSLFLWKIFEEIQKLCSFYHGLPRMFFGFLTKLNLFSLKDCLF